VPGPERMTSVLQQVEKLWRLYPDWRLGQLVANVAAWVDPSPEPLWDMEDDVLAAEIQRHIQQKGEANHGYDGPRSE